MAETSKKRKNPIGSENQDSEEEVSPFNMSPTLTPEDLGIQSRPTFTPEGRGVLPPTMTPPVPTQEIAPEVRDALTNIMQELLMKTHELSFEYSTIDCNLLQKCPLGSKSRELFKVVKELNNLVKKMNPPQK